MSSLSLHHPSSSGSIWLNLNRVLHHMLASVLSKLYHLEGQNFPKNIQHYLVQYTRHCVFLQDKFFSIRQKRAAVSIRSVSIRDASVLVECLYDRGVCIRELY